MCDVYSIKTDKIIKEAIQQFSNNNPNKDINAIKKRITFAGEFDNNCNRHTIWKSITAIQAEKLAQEMSSNYPDKIFEVVYDDVNICSLGFKWQNGKLVNGGINIITNNNLKYPKTNILEACTFAGLEFAQEYPNGKLRFFKDGKYEYFYNWEDLIDFLEHYNRYFTDVSVNDILKILNK